MSFPEGSRPASPSDVPPHVAAAQSQPPHSHPQYIQPQQHAQPQYAHQQPAQPHPAPQQLQYAPQPLNGPNAQSGYGAPRGSVNVFGVLSLVVLVVHACMSFVAPLVYRQTAMSGDISLASGVLMTVDLVLLFIALVFAIVGVTSKRAQRLRWTAFGGLVAAGVGLLASLGSILGGMVVSVLPY